MDASHAVYVAGYGQVERSLDGGSTWGQLGFGLPQSQVRQIVVSPDRNRLSAFASAAGAGTYFLAGCVREPCLASDRFHVEVSYSTRVFEPFLRAPAMPLTANTVGFTFFSPDNIDVVVKVLDGRSVNGRFWVFCAGLTNLAFRLSVVDSQTGAVKTYLNDYGQLASFADTSAF